MPPVFRPFNALVASLLWALCPIAPALAAPAPPSTLTVLATESMGPVLTVLTRRYAATNRVIISVEVGDAALLAKKITEGESGDLLIVDDPEWINTLKNQGLIDVYSQTNLARDRLVFSTPKTHLPPEPNTLEQLHAQLASGERTLFSINPGASSLGKYSEQLLERLGWPTTLPLTSIARTANRMESIQNAKDSGGAILHYASMETSTPEFARWAIPDDTMQPEIIYQMAVIASENMEPARQFLIFLKTEQASATLKRHGFEVK